MSEYGKPLVIARQMEKGTVIAHPDTQRLIKFCRKNNIGAIDLDPFISTHDVPENNNTMIEKVATEYRAIAKETGAAILLVHHTRKSGSDSLIGAARLAFTLARISLNTTGKFSAV